MSFIEMTGIAKTFSGMKVLDGVDFDVRRGEIHGLVGANGAGKTTLVHILAGLTVPDSGVIAIDGSQVAISGVAGAQKLGIGIAYQESQTLTGVSIAQSLLLGREPRGRFGIISERRIVEAARAFLSKTGISGIPVESSAGVLPEGQKRFVEAARAILVGTNLAIFDEPTAGLDSDETIRMTALIKRLKDDGVPVILISHDIPLVLGICGRVTVLKEGRRVGVFEARETTCGEISQMTGDPVSAFPARARASGDIVLSLPRAGIELHAGEIVGVETPGGDTKTGIIRAIFGVDPRSRGDYSIFGFKMRTGPPGGAVKHRIGLSSDERKLRNSALYLTIRKKTAYALVEHSPIRMGSESPFAGMPGFGGKSDPLSETAATTQNLFEPSEALEGRLPGDLMLGGVEVVIFDEPSRGADEAAKAEIYKLMNELANRGKGIIMFSLDKRELDGMCGLTAQIK